MSSPFLWAGGEILRWHLPAMPGLPQANLEWEGRRYDNHKLNPPRQSPVGTPALQQRWAAGMASGFSVAALYERRNSSRFPAATNALWWRPLRDRGKFGAPRAPLQGGGRDAKLAGV